MNLMISLDDGKTWTTARLPVRMVALGLTADLDQDEIAAQLGITITHEGVILDVWAEDSSIFTEVLGTSSETFQEITERLTGEPE